ncbi:MAG TPA: ATP-binding protein [Patescibacteria group bacterium]|nr:ATP-binding protein [Patescibacteria group bacterium]
MAKKIVFTGGFSVGKTTTIQMLHHLGYAVAPESSESVVNEFRLSKGSYPWEDEQSLLRFHEDIFNKQIESEENINSDITFFDRGIPDRLAFLKFDNLPIPQKMLEHAKSCGYDKVFFLEGDNSSYVTASHRPYGLSDSLRFVELVKEIYSNLGHDLIVIPFCPKEERLKIILEKIK